MGSGVAAAGRLLARGAASVGESVVAAYRTLDPDLVRHMAQLPLMGLTQLAPSRPRNTERLSADGHRAVIFVHGLGGGSGNFLPMQIYFRWRGRTCTYAVSFASEEGVQQMADELAAFVRWVTETQGLPGPQSVDLVAHSMGGLVCRAALEDPEIAACVGRVITLATPHQGTEMARLTQTPRSLDLRPNSPLIARLDQQLPWARSPGAPELISMWSESDVVLMPPESAQVEGATNLRRDGYTHYTFLLHPESWEQTFDLLHDPPRTPNS